MATLTPDRLLSLEHDGWASLCEGRGGRLYGELMTPDGLMVLVDGTVLDRATIAATLDDAPPWDSYEIREPRRVGLGDRAAALVYRARAVRGDQVFTALMSSSYRVVDGEPRLALYQQTTVTH